MFGCVYCVCVAVCNCYLLAVCMVVVWPCVFLLVDLCIFGGCP